MSYSIPVIPRSTQASAFQLVIGETTASQIRDFVGSSVDVGAAMGDDRDIRWITVQTVNGLEQAQSGDWIVISENGVIELVQGDAFHQLYRPATETARDTLRARDITDPRVQEAHLIAKNFAKTLRGE